MTDQIESNKNQYLDTTHKLNDYNEIYNLNTYLLRSNTQELDKLEGTNNLLKTRILKMKQEYMLFERDQRMYGFRRNLLYLSTLVVSGLLVVAALFVQGTLQSKMAVIICAGVGIVYLIILVLMVLYNSRRTTYSYDHIYWKPIKK